MKITKTYWKQDVKTETFLQDKNAKQAPNLKFEVDFSDQW